ncbi:MAG: adenosylcobinamide amidohydrolase [Deltaproteobacteria bacterium]|jgi:adenosylcobinamide amidohydrolase/ABC-type Fe3+-hydroxamate transport system substrate-binding protein|nr:adenosylcobinamide amidohydrolase [Deltaproteobacteria bacterium]
MSCQQKEFLSKIIRPNQPSPHYFVVITLVIFLLTLSFGCFFSSTLLAYKYLDDLGRELNFASTPQRVVSLVPGATESLCAIKAGEALKGITTDDVYFECLIGVPAVGPADDPDLNRVTSLKPDLLIVSPALFQSMSLNCFPGLIDKTVVWREDAKLKASEARIMSLGELFNRKKEALLAVDESLDFFKTISLKTEKIPLENHKRVMRLRAGEEGLLTGAVDSLDSELIKAAGGVPPELTGQGLVKLSPEEFVNFDPELVYACQKDRSAVTKFSQISPWSQVKAFKLTQVKYFPCALTDRISSHAGYFAAWLSSEIYADEFGDPDNFVYPSKEIKTTQVEIQNIPYVKKASVSEFKLFDFTHRTLLIDFTEPRDIVTTGDGNWEKVTSIGNSSSPPMVWGIHHKGGWEKAQETLFKTLGLKKDKTALIFTGADMRNLSVKSASYEELTVTALITAGADGNAVRTSRDAGAWHDPGTINILLLTNRSLSREGAASALIVVTEAKTAALWDMDIRSSETPLVNPATGTGTDDITVVGGLNGSPLSYTGGHSKIGELIAQVVYQGVTEALRRQNGKAPDRPVWTRLAERGILIEELGVEFSGHGQAKNFKNNFIKLMLEPKVASLIEAAFSLDDARCMGELSDLSQFETLAAAEAAKIAGQDIGPIRNLVSDNIIPPALKSALNALGTALLVRQGL